MKFSSTVRYIAEKEGTTPENVLEEMKAAIQAAKGNENFKYLFGEKEPTPEEFVQVIASLLQSGTGKNVS